MAFVTVQVPISNAGLLDAWLLETEYDTDFLPDVGDRLHPLKNDEDSGLSFEIGKRWWMEDGKVVLEITKYVLDPVATFRSPRGWRGWVTERDGDLVQMLLDNGWWYYGKRPDVISQKTDNEKRLELVRKIVEQHRNHLDAMQTRVWVELNQAVNVDI